MAVHRAARPDAVDLPAGDTGTSHPPPLLCEIHKAQPSLLGSPATLTAPTPPAKAKVYTTPQPQLVLGSLKK